MSQLQQVYHVQQGSSGTLKVSDEDAWYVIRETWEERKLLNTSILDMYSSQAAALAALPEFANAEALS